MKNFCHAIEFDEPHMSKEDRFDADAKRTDKVLKYHDMQLNNSEIAKLVDCSRENVRQILQRLGLVSHVAYYKNRHREEETV